MHEQQIQTSSGITNDPVDTGIAIAASLNHSVSFNQVDTDGDGIADLVEDSNWNG